jgi:hypothetical protein
MLDFDNGVCQGIRLIVGSADGEMPSSGDFPIAVIPGGMSEDWDQGDRRPGLEASSSGSFSGCERDIQDSGFTVP